MKLFGYIDDLVNRFIIPVFDGLPIWLNAVIFSIVVSFIFTLYNITWREK